MEAESETHKKKGKGSKKKSIGLETLTDLEVEA